MQRDTPSTTAEIDELYSTLRSKSIFFKLAPISVIGYHGTSTRNAERIVAEQHVVETSDRKGLLGRGAYFYEDQPHRGHTMAMAWAKFEKRYPAQAVVAASIEAARVWDLTAAENHRYFQAVFDWVVEKVKLSRPQDVWKVTAAKVAKFIMGTCPQQRTIQCVRWNGFRVKEIRMPGQYGLAVRDAKCITKLWLHSKD